MLRGIMAGMTIVMAISVATMANEAALVCNDYA
jgi:hypothetical protein